MSVKKPLKAEHQFAIPVAFFNFVMNCHNQINALQYFVTGSFSKNPL
jgi:hypothetical protein